MLPRSFVIQWVGEEEMAGTTVDEDRNENSLAATNPNKENGGGSSSDETVIKKRGRCKWFNVAKGWGFITPEDGSQDVFVHQSVIKMTGFRSLADSEVVEFLCKVSDKGLEATHVSGPEDSECKGSSRRPLNKKRFRKIRCYNCGEFSNHIAAKCTMGPQPKRCHNCKSEDHLIADCPLKPAQPDPTNNGGGSSGEATSGEEASAQENNKH